VIEHLVAKIWFVVQVFNLVDGILLSYRSQLHSRNITAIMFFNRLNCLLTAAKDGTSKMYLYVG